MLGPGLLRLDRRGPQGVAQGDERAAGGEEYVFAWETEIERAGAEPISFHQSDFAATLPSLAALRRRADAFVPTLDGDGEVDAFALARMDGRATVGEVARAVMERFPGRFARWEDALSRVGTLSDRYSA